MRRYGGTGRRLTAALCLAACPRAMAAHAFHLSRMAKGAPGAATGRVEPSLFGSFRAAQGQTRLAAARGGVCLFEPPTSLQPRLGPCTLSRPMFALQFPPGGLLPAPRHARPLLPQLQPWVALYHLAELATRYMLPQHT